MPTFGSLAKPPKKRDTVDLEALSNEALLNRFDALTTELVKAANGFRRQSKSLFLEYDQTRAEILRRMNKSRLSG